MEYKPIFSSCKKAFEKNSEYSIFIFVNDFMPNYPLSSWRQSRRFLLKFRSIAWIYSKLRPSLLALVNANDDAYLKVLEKTVNSSFEDCSSINNQYFKVLKHQQRIDHLVFAKDSTCWPKKYILAVDHALNELINIGDIINKENSSIRFFILPISISFVNEQSEGRSFYKIPSNIAITQRGLNEYILRNLPFNTIDLEPIFRNEISKKRKDCPSVLINSFKK